jgi:hypothetical protein
VLHDCGLELTEPRWTNGTGTHGPISVAPEKPTVNRCFKRLAVGSVRQLPRNGAAR